MSTIDLSTSLLSDRVVGTCSLCKGAVTCPNVYLSTVPPVPKCSRCGATKKDPYGPVVEMVAGSRDCTPFATKPAAAAAAHPSLGIAGQSCPAPVVQEQYHPGCGSWYVGSMPGVIFTEL